MQQHLFDRHTELFLHAGGRGGGFRHPAVYLVLTTHHFSIVSQTLLKNSLHKGSGQCPSSVSAGRAEKVVYKQAEGENAVVVGTRTKIMAKPFKANGNLHRQWERQG